MSIIKKYAFKPMEKVNIFLLMHFSHKLDILRNVMNGVVIVKKILVTSCPYLSHLRKLLCTVSIHLFLLLNADMKFTQTKLICSSKYASVESCDM